MKVKTTGISLWLFIDLVVARVWYLVEHKLYSEVRKSDKGANSFQIQLQLIHLFLKSFLDNIFILEK